MDRENIEKMLSQKISTDILKQPNSQLDPQEAIISSGLIDSFSLVDLALIVEDLFGVRVEDYELNADTFDTVEELAELIQKKQEDS